MSRVLARGLHSAVVIFLLGFTSVVSQKCYSKYKPTRYGYCNEPQDCTGAALTRKCNNENSTTVCCIQGSSISPTSPTVLISRETFYHIVGETLRTQAVYPFLNQALIDANITVKDEIAVFIAQVLYTTKNLTISEELSDGSQYEGDSLLGNTKVGDGARFRSRGFLPILGRAQYQRVNSELGENLLDDPERAALPSTGFKIASWLWKNGYSATSNEGLGKYCDGTLYNFIELSYEIHGETNDIETLQGYWWSVLKVLALPCPKTGMGPSCTIDGKNGTCMVESTCKSRYATDTQCSTSPLIKCCIDCENPADLALLVDSSGSVGPMNFFIALQFMAGLFDIAPDGTRAALIRFNTNAEVLLHFNDYTNKSDISNAIKSVQYVSGGTSTDLALELAHKELFGTQKSGVRPKSYGIPRVLVLLTDGRASRGSESVRGPSEVLRADGVSIFVVGIGPSVKLDELNVIASDPDEDHVYWAQSFESVSRDVKLMHEYYCNEPAVLEANATISSRVEHHSLKYYKYEPPDANGIQRIHLKPVQGKARLSVSLTDRNPRHRKFSTDFCGDADESKHSFSSSFQFEKLEKNGQQICIEHPDGVVSEPVILPDGSFVVYALMCSSKRIFFSVEGMGDPNGFNITLTEGILDFPDGGQGNSTEPGNSSFTFAIRREVYVSAGVAMTTTGATVAAYVTLSCAGKSFEIQSSSKLKKKKKKNKKDEGSNNNDVEKGETKTTDTNSGKETSKKANGAVLASVTVEKETPSQSRDSKANGPKNNGRDKSGGKDAAPKLAHRNKSTISSMIGALSRKDSRPPTGETSKASGGAGKKKEVRSGSVTVEVQGLNAAGPNRKQNSVVPTTKSTGIGSVSSQPRVSMSHKPKTGTSNTGRGSDSQGGGVEKQGLLSSESSHSLETNTPDASGNGASCCVVCLPCCSSNKNLKSAENEAEGSNASEHGGGEQSSKKKKKKKKSLKERIKASFTKRNIMACFLPCVTYYILDKRRTEDGDTDLEAQEKREKRLERDMKISQAFCVLLSQLIFFLGADNTENKAQCAAVAISMNYLYLVALGWLISQALYIFSFTKSNQSAKSRSRAVKYYYICAWGLPLIVVCIMLGNTDAISDNAHCWISFMDSASWAVSTPIITMSLVQVIIVILLIKALVTFKKSNDKEHDEMRMGIIKSGLLTVVCLTLTVLLTWFMGTMSMNIDKKVYSDAYAVLNAGQGVLLFFFFVVLSPEVRMFLTSAWLFIQHIRASAVTPFDEHEGLEIEEDEEKEKKKKKKKGKTAKATETGASIAMASTALTTNAKTKSGANADAKNGSAQPRKLGTAKTDSTPAKKQPPKPATTSARKPSQAGVASKKATGKTTAGATQQRKVSSSSNGPLKPAKNHPASSKGKQGQNLPPVKSPKDGFPAATPRSPNARRLEPLAKGRPKSPYGRTQGKNRP